MIEILSYTFIETLKSLPFIEEIWLFGSRARGTHYARSDIDIALDTGKPLPRVDIGEARDMLAESNIPYKIDVVDVHGVSQEMREAIYREGIIWRKI